jgi:hypothetical protein
MWPCLDFSPLNKNTKGRAPRSFGPQHEPVSVLPTSIFHLSLLSSSGKPKIGITHAKSRNPPIRPPLRPLKPPTGAPPPPLLPGGASSSQASGGGPDGDGADPRRRAGAAAHGGGRWKQPVAGLRQRHRALHPALHPLRVR